MCAECERLLLNRRSSPSLLTSAGNSRNNFLFYLIQYCGEHCRLPTLHNIATLK
jgi:hypothetical protein